MKLLHKNTLSGIGQFTISSGLAFFSIPLFIRGLGEEAYGAFSLITVVGNLNLFANLGLNASLLKYISEQGKTRESNYDIVVTLCLLIGILFPLSTLAIIYRSTILHDLLGMSTTLYVRVAPLYVCVVIANLFLMIGQTFTMMLDSQLRMYLTNLYQLIYSVLYWGGSILVIIIGFDLPEIGLVVVSASVVWFFLTIVTAFRVWGKLDITGLPVHFRRVVKKQVGYGSKIYTAGLISFAYEPMTKLLVSQLIGIKEVGYLEIAYKIRSQFWSLITKATYPLYPQLTQENNTEKLGKLIVDYQTVIGIVLMPLLIILVLTSGDVLSLWLHTTNPTLLAAALWIPAAYLFGTVAIPFSFYLIGKHHADKAVWLQVVNAVVNAIIILVTYRVLGVYSAILGNSMAILSSLSLCIFLQKRYLNNMPFNAEVIGKALLITILGGGIASCIQYAIHDTILRILSVTAFTLVFFVIAFRRSYLQFRSQPS